MHRLCRSPTCCIVVLLCSVSFCGGYLISIDVNSKSCFFDKVSSGTKMTLIFEVSDGGSLDIDVKIIGPDENRIYYGKKESSGRHSFTAPLDGAYIYCFSNEMSSLTRKTVTFQMQMDELPTEDDAGTESPALHNTLEGTIADLARSLASVKDEQEFMEVRNKVHASINENTNFRVVMWAFFEATVLVAMVTGQIIYLKYFFEVRTIV